VMPILLVTLAQTTPIDTTGFTSDQRFWYAMASLVVPIILGALTLVGSILAILQARSAKHEAAASNAATAAVQEELGVVHSKVNGQGEQMRSLTERAARAEGRVETFEQVQAAPAPPAQPTILVVPTPPVTVAPPSRTGNERTRSSDRAPDLPVTPPADPPSPTP
jgi:hypothetical protein